MDATDSCSDDDDDDVVLVDADDELWLTFFVDFLFCAVENNEVVDVNIDVDVGILCKGVTLHAFVVEPNNNMMMMLQRRNNIAIIDSAGEEPLLERKFRHDSII